MTTTTKTGNLMDDIAAANLQSTVGQFLTARQMAHKPHNLSADGMTAHAMDGGVWGWSGHFNVWACVQVAR